MGTNKKRRAKLARQSRSGRLYYRDDQDLFRHCAETGEDLSFALREAVYDGLLYRRLLAGVPDTDSAKPATLPMTVNELNETVVEGLNGVKESMNERLTEIEKGLREVLAGGGGAGPPITTGNRGNGKATDSLSKEETRRQALADLLSDPSILEEMFAPLAEHLHLLRVESEFTFRLVYCVREFVKQYLVREQIQAELPPAKMPPTGPARATQLAQLIETMLLTEQTMFDGRALVALENIRTGKIYANNPGTNPSPATETQPTRRCPPGASRAGGPLTTNDLDQITAELEEEHLLDHQSSLEEAERADESTASESPILEE